MPALSRRQFVLALALAAALGVAFPVLSSALPAAVTSNAVASVATPADRAWQWVLGQRGSGTDVVSPSSIQGDRTYPSGWTGAVAGTFTPRGVTAAIDDPASLVVDSPTPLPGKYAGVVHGHVTVPPQDGRWIVQGYRATASGRTEVPVQALVSAEGSFSIDLSTVANPPPGTWALGLLDAHHAYAPTGTPWPAVRTYVGWQVRAYVVTDTAYLVGTEPARVDGTFAFADSRPGTKVFQLVDTTHGDAVLAEDAPDFGLLRSYAGGTRAYTYDQALAVIAAVAQGGDATSLTAGLLRLQRSDGSFVESADVRNPDGAAPIVRTGISAIATYALLRRLQTTTAADESYAAVSGAARRGVAWLVAEQRPDGLVGAGVGDYRADGTIDAAATPAWVSTEHNLDAWQTLHLAATMLPDTAAATSAARLATAVVSALWSSAEGRFRQGLAADGRPDETDPLDVSSWGALFLQSTGQAQLAAQALVHTAAFTSSTGGVSGYRAYYPQPAFANAPANVWVEGSAGVALARLRAGDQPAANAVLAQLARLQRADGSLPYATVADDATSMTTAGSVAAASWFMLASLAPGATTIWD